MTTHPSKLSRTRLAPTPSGYLHAGNAFNFLLTEALAQENSAAVLLRIDDLDRERYRKAYAQDVFDTLRFLNIQWSEGPKGVDDFEKRWSQRQRLTLYEEALKKLRDAKAVFACTCSRIQLANCRCREKELPLNAPGSSWRLLTDDEPVAVQTLDGTARKYPLPKEVKDFVVRKKDGFPSYQLASLIDDLHFNIGFIVRGQDLWPSTLAQQFLAKRLGEERFASIAFLHHPLLSNEGGEKLSKSAGDTSVRHWRESGKTLPDLVSWIGRSLGLTGVNEAGDLLKIFARRGK